jgi:hypothetical protein
MFNNCPSLTTIPALSTTSLTTQVNFFWSTFSLKKCQVPLKFTFTVANWMMSWDALDELYTALPTVSWQTITVTWNYWTATDDPTIATAKGWTVTW